MRLKLKKGLDIPLAGKPEGPVQELFFPAHISLNLSSFDDLRFRLLIKTGDKVAKGQPLIENKAYPGQMFVAPASGVLTEIRRGAKRLLLDLIISVDYQETNWDHKPINTQTASREELIEFFMGTGLFPHLSERPLNRIPNPAHVPRDIFITALETRPFEPPQELQVAGQEIYFQAGLDALTKLTTGKVHLVYSEKTTCAAFLDAEGVEKHTASGPHPSGSSSVHIHFIAPIRSPEDRVWALTALDAVVIGKMVLEGSYYTDRIIAIAGDAILHTKRGFFKGRIGFPILDLMANRITQHPSKLISGDPLTGSLAEPENFLGFHQTCFSALLENTTREPFHFLRLGTHKFTATKTYLSGHIPYPEEGFVFTTNQHGEERAFIDSAVYDRVMPMRIPTPFLIKAIITENFELAEQLGLLEVTPEDFALPTFICPSKIEMVEIVKQGLKRYAQEM
jgi:Na+-transporting NADH:ubiquinone oxidoreductase subunit A